MNGFKKEPGFAVFGKDTFTQYTGSRKHGIKRWLKQQQAALTAYLQAGDSDCD